MPLFLRTPLWCALSTALLGLCAQAQTLPNAGQILESLEQKRPEQPAPATIELLLPDTPTPAADDTGPTIEVQRFAIEGNSAIDTADLLALLQPLEGQSLTLSQLEAGAARITQRYRENGYPFAYAYLPQQTVDAGLVRVAVLEGRLGQVHIENKSRQRAHVVATPLRLLRSGEVIHADALETSLLLLGDVSGARAKSRLQPGTEVGTTDLVVQVEDAPLISGSLGLDNFGTRGTGIVRATGSLRLNGALGLGEQIHLHTLLSNDRLRNYHLGYEMPVGPWSTRVGASLSQMNYETGGAFSVLDNYGSGKVASIHATQPLVRSRSSNLNAKLSYDQKRLADHIGLQDSHERKRSHLTTLGLNGNWQDSLISRAVSQWDLSWSHGQLRLGSDEQRELDALTTRTAGRFQVLNGHLARWQALGGPWMLHGRVNGQWANKNLNTSEKMSLGGAYGVRAYPQGEAQADMGLLGSLELQYALTDAWQLSGFVDGGRVKFQHSPWTHENNHRSLAGAGFGLKRSGPSWSLESSLAWRVGNGPATSAQQRSPALLLKLQVHL